MEDVKGKMKGLMKKVNNPFSSSSSSSSSGKFRGQGRVLGSSTSPGPLPSSSSSAAAAAAIARSNPAAPPNPHQRRLAATASRPSNPPAPIRNPPSPTNPPAATGQFECPICARPYPSEEEVSEHIDSCLLLAGGDTTLLDEEGASSSSSSRPDTSSYSVAAAGDDIDVAARIGEFVSGDPPAGSVEVVLRLLGNVVGDPDNAKFRRIRLSNPKIKESVGAARGGLELLECVGFRLGVEEDGELWATMGVSADKHIFLIKQAVSLLERWRKEGDSSSAPLAGTSGEILLAPKKVDRQIQVFFPVPESVAAKIELPGSFYALTAEELKREVELRKKKIAESQLLIPRSYKEKQMKASRKRYKATIIRVQFPDGVVLQGVFLPWEPAAVLYEFVSSALKAPSLEFELLKPGLPKLQVIPRFQRSGERNPTLEEEDLVPSALVKFKAIETDSIPFTGLTNELLQMSEPLTAVA